jgi:hypothetical protein
LDKNAKDSNRKNVRKDIRKKKNTLMIAMVSVMALLAAACAGGGAAKVNPAEAYADISESIAMPEMMEIPSAIVLDYYGIQSDDYSDAVFYISADSLLADEVVIVNTVDAEAAKRVKDKLEVRLNQKLMSAQDYSPEQYEIIRKCKVRSDGLTVAMLVSPDVQGMTSIYEKHLK